jgi:hypothetical protein
MKILKNLWLNLNFWRIKRKTGLKNPDSINVLFLITFRLVRAYQEKEMASAWIQAEISRNLENKSYWQDVSSWYKEKYFKVIRTIIDNPQLTEDQFKEIINGLSKSKKKNNYSPNEKESDNGIQMVRS